MLPSAEFYILFYLLLSIYFTLKDKVSVTPGSAK